MLHRRAHPALLPQEIGLLFLLFLLLPFSVVAQVTDTVAYWDAAWRNERDGTVVLNDDLSIRLRNVKPQFLAVFIERKRTIRFGSMDDIERFARVVLPESLDPPFDERFTPWQQRDGAPPTRWLNVRLDLFTARVVEPEASARELPVARALEHEEFRTLRTLENPWSHVMQVLDIAPGDVVEFHWKYMLPYDFSWPASTGWRSLEWVDNWARLTSWRIFFHDRLPVRQQRVELLYHLKHGLVATGPQPQERIEDGNEVRLVWRHRDLPGCINEPNARPATDLPHVSVQLVPEDFRYWRRDRLSGIAFPQPYWLQVVRYREARAFWWRQVSRKRLPDKQNALVRAFIRDAGGEDSSAVVRMIRIHDHVAQHFDYAADRLWYMDMDLGLPRIGEQVRDGVVRDISRYDLYSKLLNSLRIDHSTAYVLDERIGRLTDRYLTPMWDTEFLFGIRNGDGMLWMHPKRSRYGLLAGELPFYWQGTAALLIDLELLIDDLPPPARFVDLPLDDPAGNVRGIEYSVDIDLSAGTATGRAQVFLSGQFSTLGRAAYLGFPLDSTVDVRYGWRPSEVPGVRSKEWAPGQLSTEPPFRFRTEATVDLSALLEQHADGSWTFDPSPLVVHVVPDAYTLEGRALPWYWDFLHQDRFRFELRFNGPVEVMDHGTVPGKMEGAGAALERRMFQRGADRLVLVSELKVDQRRVDLEEIPALKRVLAAAPEGWPIRVRPLHQRE